MANCILDARASTLNPCVPKARLAPIMECMDEAKALLTTMTLEDYLINNPPSRVFETLCLLRKHVGYAGDLLEKSLTS
jgi:hypothetical protein